MGVTQLWQVLGPVEQHVPLSSLNGQILAVDLSIWVCENQCVKQMQGIVAKPFLRNLFFRISHLTQLGVKLVFVIEGAAPELKWDTMVKRQQTRFPVRAGKQSPQKQAGKQTRRNFNCWLKECCELLEIMGIPYIQSKGEAEALCALLNAAGLVDGCLTNDGDAFLYGAKRVYRNFTMNSKDPHVEMFQLSDIETKLGIDRSGLIALGLLVGCDFVPKGVPGIGVANSVRLLQSLHGQDVLTRLQLWKTMSEKDCVDQVEVLARRKAIQVPEFPQTKVIDEFLVVKDRCPSQLPQWKRPVLAKLQEFALIKLEWPVEYTLEKILPLMTLWDMLDILQSRNPSMHQHLKPHRIVKTRVRQGEPCFEVEWHKPVTESMNEDIYYVTIESQDLFSKCYSDVVKTFENEQTENKKKTKAKKKKKKQPALTSPTPTLDKLSFQFEKINLKAVTSGLQKSAEDLHPSFSEYNESTLTTKAKQPRHLTLSPNSKKPCTKTATVDLNSETSVSNVGHEVYFSKIGRKLAVNDDSPHNIDEDEGVMSLSQRVQLRMKNKTESSKESMMISAGANNRFQKCSGKNVQCVKSLSEGIQNLSLNERIKLGQKDESSVPMVTKSKLSSPALFGSKPSPACVMSRKSSLKESLRQMSSPSTDTFCSPMTYMKHKGDLGDSFEIQRSPYYIEYPSAHKQRTDVNCQDINSPGFFSRRESHSEEKIDDSKSTAEKLVEKLDAGISQVGGGSASKSGLSMFGSKKLGGARDEQIMLKSLQSLLNSSTGSVMTSSNSLNKTPSRLENQSTQDSTSPSDFGDFQLQTSLMNSLCTSLVQALTPKGVSMTKAEYEQLVATLNEIDSEENPEMSGLNNHENDELVNNIDFAEIEKVSTNIKNINQNLLLRPIQIDDEDVMSKLSKSARKKLRRKERKAQEMENLVKIQNMSLNKQKLNKKQKSDLKTRLSHPNTDDNDGNKRKKQIICSPSKDNSKSKSQSNEGRHKGGPKHTSDTKTESKVVKDVRSPVSDMKCASKYRKDGKNCVEVKNDLKQANDAKHGEEYRNGATVVGSDVTEVNKKKKKRKKKVKKASPVIDLSANDSLLDDSKVAVCGEYLKQALENSRKKQGEKKIVKASPFMDLSADDTLLQLEGLSCKVVGEELDSDLDIKLKIKTLKQKRLQSRNKVGASVVEEFDMINNPPILSLVDMNSKADDSVGIKSEDLSKKSKTQDTNVSKLQENVGQKCSCGLLSSTAPTKELSDICEIERNNINVATVLSESTKDHLSFDFQREQVSGTKNEDVVLSMNSQSADSGNDTGLSLQEKTFENNKESISNKWCYKIEDQDVEDDLKETPKTKEGNLNNFSENESKNVCRDDDQIECLDYEEDVDVVANGADDCDNDGEKVACFVPSCEQKTDLTSMVKCNIVGNMNVHPGIDQKQKIEVPSLDTCNFENDTCELGLENGNSLSCFDADTSNCVDFNEGGDGGEVEHLKRSDRELSNENLETDQSGRDQSSINSSLAISNRRQGCTSEKLQNIEKSNDSSQVFESSLDVDKDSKCEPGSFMDHWSANEDACSNLSERFTYSKLTNSLSPSVPASYSNLLPDNILSSVENGLSSEMHPSVATEDTLVNVDEAVIESTCVEQVTQSPACLADRLKLKLREKSTRNLLESFTNWK